MKKMNVQLILIPVVILLCIGAFTDIFSAGSTDKALFKNKMMLENKGNLLVKWQDNNIYLYYDKNASYESEINQVSVENLQSLVQIYISHQRQANPQLTKNHLIDMAKDYIIRINHLRYDLLKSQDVLQKEIGANNAVIDNFKDWIQGYNLFYLVEALEEINTEKSSKELHRQIALLYDIRDNHSKALEHFEKAFEPLALVVFLDDSAKKAVKQKQLSKAMLYQQKALPLLKTLKGAKSPEYASVLGNTATTLIGGKQYREAFALLDEVIVIYQELYEPNNTRLLAQQLTQASLYRRFGQADKTVDIIQNQLLDKAKNTELHEYALSILAEAKKDLAGNSGELQ